VNSEYIYVPSTSLRHRVVLTFGAICTVPERSWRHNN